MPVDLSTDALIYIALTSGVTSTVISVGVNLVFTVWKDWKARMLSGTYSAARIATTLERFVHECDAQLTDNDLAVSSKGAAGKAGVSLPKFPSYPKDVDWKALPIYLSERALTMPNEVELVSLRSIRFMWDVLGDDDETSIMETARCGLKALELAAELRVHYNLPDFAPNKPTRERLLTQLEEAKQREEQERLSGMVVMQDIQSLPRT